MSIDLSEPLTACFEATNVHDVSASGTFQGNPIALPYRFEVDGRKITRLEIE